mmetsp:Transcript_46956/g.130452  ORF Transcript_46956/g.130452 Transcript_46956/m.130452 type:complete len:139 (+) Transcript_46956:890-1306(+)
MEPAALLPRNAAKLIPEVPRPEPVVDDMFDPDDLPHEILHPDGLPPALIDPEDFLEPLACSNELRAAAALAAAAVTACGRHDVRHAITPSFRLFADTDSISFVSFRFLCTLPPHSMPISATDACRYNESATSGIASFL